MGCSTRCAEWNYLFGALLMQTRETEKAIMYLSVAAHQRPDSAKYARALAEARKLAEDMYCVQFASIPDFIVRMRAAKFIPHTDMERFPSIRKKLPENR